MRSDRACSIPGDRTINGANIRDLSMSAARALMMMAAAERPGEPLEASAEMDGYAVSVIVRRTGR